MKLLQILVIYMLLTGFSCSGTDNTKHLSKCSDLSQQFNFIMKEDTKPGFILYNITLGGNINVRFDPPDPYLSAKVEGGYGIISLNQSFDYERIHIGNEHFYEYTVTCEYPYNKMRVTIENVVEITPKLSQTVYNKTVEENTQIGSIIQQILVLRGDATNDDLMVTSANTPSHFKLEKLISGTELTCSLTLIQNLSYAVKHQYEFDIEVYVIANPSMRGSAKVIINVKDVDDQNPKFNSAAYEISIQEGGYQVDNKDFRYDVTWVSVTILDVDDNPPILDQTSYAISIPENSPDHTNIVQVHGTDIDEGNNAKFHYYFYVQNKNETICNGTEIDKDTGMIRVHQSSVLDRETTPIIICQVIAKADYGLSHSDIGSVTITLIDENDNNPVFNSSKYSYNIKKDIDNGHTIGQIYAHDKDQNSIITYQIPDTSLSTFKVDEITGKITLNSLLNEIFAKLYTFEVVASDGDKKAPRYTSVNVFIHVEDVNTHVPRFDSKQYNVTVLEDVSIGTNLIQLTAADQDPDDKLTYSIDRLSDQFNINKLSGMLSVAKELDYDKTNIHRVTVFVNDSVHSASTTVTVNLVDINDNAPMFNNAAYLFRNITEGQLNISVGKVTATDADSGDNKQIAYRIETPWSANFTVDSSTGVITSNGILDRESIEDEQGRITVVVIATDKGHIPLTGTTEVTVWVTDVNDNCPYIDAQDLKVTYIFDELSNPNNFHHIVAQDMDRTEGNRHMIYSFIGRHDGFTISTAGYVSTTKQLVMEDSNNGHFELQIEVSNDPDCTEKSKATQNVTIQLQDVNRYPPLFNNSIYTFDVKENLTVGSQLSGSRILATDKDATAQYNTVTYWIEGGSGMDHFYMDQRTAQIFLVKPLDYENTTKYILTVHATDGHLLYNKSSSNTTATVTINVENVNDNPPKFDQDNYVCNFQENKKTSENSCKVSATDRDPSTSLLYSLNDTSVFQILPTGEITVKSNGLDYENGRHHYTLVVYATDSGMPILTGTSLVEINVINVNDNPPVFSGSYNFTVMEDAPVSTIIGVISATDADGDRLKYTVDNAGFLLHQDTGLLSLKTSLVDKTSMAVTVHVTDGSKTATSSVTVTILDVNNHPPVFNSSAYFQSVTENVDNAFIVTVQATDADRGDNQIITYRIETPWSTTFSVNSSTGVIRTIVALDRESIEDVQGRIKFVVIATDHGSVPLSGTTEVTVEVTDENDNCPYIDAQDLKVSYIFDELSQPTNFHQVVAQDMDRTEGNRHMNYSFNGHYDGFMISPTGYVSATKQLVMEDSNNGHFELQIQVSNVPDCSKHNKSTQTVTIQLQDVNRYPPLFNNSVYTFNVKEDLPVGNQLPGSSIFATDKDATAQYSTVTYWIGNGSGMDHFYMDQRTAQIFLVKPLDYENEKHYSLTIHATDGHLLYNTSSSNTTATVIINVENVNDNPPMFDQGHYVCNFQENKRTSDNSCKVSAIDRDPSTSLLYSLNDTSVFQISSHGEITVKSTGLDYDNGKHHYTLIVSATDSGMPILTGTTIVEINVLNVNDNPPVFSGSYNFTVMEDAPVSTIIGLISATDADGDRLQYTVDHASGFMLHPDSGLLSLNKSLVDKTSMVVTVHVTDGNKTDTASVTVTIQDVNNHSPVFSSPTYFHNVEENVDNAAVVTVEAIDADSSLKNKQIIYSIDPLGSQNFTIDKNTGVIKVRGHLDREMSGGNGTITFIVMATDQGQPPLTGTAEVIVAVSDVNDNCPYYSLNDKDITYVFKEYEKPQNFHNFMPIDDDITLGYQLSHFDLPKFELQGLNYTANASFAFLLAEYPLIIGFRQIKQVNTLTFNLSQNCPMKTEVTHTVTIIVEDVNDHIPVFTSNTYSFVVPENFTEGGTINIERVKANDEDPTAQYNTVIYKIIKGNEDGHFHIDTFTGDIFLLRQLDYETKQNYTLQITATDGQPFYNSSSVRTSTASVEITVSDVNDNSPQFDKVMYRCKVSENFNGSISGCDLMVTDLDQGNNGRFSLSIQNATEFNISQSGNIWQVGVNKPLDYDRGPRLYNLIVVAKDDGIPSKSSSSSVEITVINRNDNAPYFVTNPQYNITIPEDIQPGSLIGRISAGDIDGDNLTFSVVNTDFRVDRESGELFTYGNFVNKLNPITLALKVTDSIHTTQANVTIHIKDVNNNPPVFINSTYKFTLNENESNKMIGKVQATDDDKGKNSEIEYKLEPSDWSNNFTISLTSGEIHVSGSLDREHLDNTNGQITLVVMATDKGSPPLTGTTEVIVAVNDLNDNCPYFMEQDRKIVYIQDELTVPLNFHTAIAFDKDSTIVNSRITYNLTQGSPYFTVMSSNGSLSATQPLKMETSTNGRFDIMIGAYNSGCRGSGAGPALQHVTVILKDVNNYSPVLRNHSYSFNLPENFNTGSPVNDLDRISAVDNDTDKQFNTVTYWILGGNVNDTFHVDHYTGVIYLVKQLDYDAGPKLYTLQISAIDCLNSTDGHCKHNDTAVVHISITDVNDNPPRFNTDAYFCTVKEGFEGLINNCKVTATDNDSGTNKIFTYHSMNTTFNVSSSGDLFLLSKLDYETGYTEYSVIIHAIDQGNPALTGVATVKVTLLDTNDNDPVFAGVPYKFGLNENEPNGTIIGVISATDKDTNSALEFGILNHTSEFEMSKNGLLTSKKIFDYEVGPKIYYIEVEVSDRLHNITATVTVDVRNVNDNQPWFGQQIYNVTVKEDITTKFFQLGNATDIDNIGTLSYSIVGGDGSCSSIFSMSDKGMLYINNTIQCLDYDISKVHTLLIQAKDANPLSHFSRSVVQIDIEDVDNKPPKFYWPKYNATIKENERLGSEVIRVKAFDKDTPDNHLIYHVISDAYKFQFNGNVMVTKTLLDAEERTVYSVNISVTDGSRTDFAIVIILVEDVNDNSPIFTKDLRNFSIPANAEGNRYVGTVNATDKDVSNNGFTFYLFKEDHFWINDTTGELFVLDGHGDHYFEANKTYKVIVNVLDHGQPPNSNSTVISIFIDITNHFAPTFLATNTTNIAENASIYTLVTMVTAIDPDPGNAGVVRYRLVPNQLYDDKFAIDETTGRITLKGQLDFETSEHYELAVLAIDKADDPKTGTTHVKIIVTDVNEKPQFLEKMDGMCIQSPISQHTTVAVVSARDPDTDDVLAYSLRTTTDFNIDKMSGHITANKNLTNHNFTITVTVTDKGGLTDTMTIDLYNNPSLVITPAIIAVNVTENNTNHYVAKVNAISKSNLTYTLINSTGFSIDRNGNINSTYPLDRETQDQIVIHVMVNSSTSSCQAQVNIKVIDINDNPPRFGFHYDMATVSEDISNNTCFFSLPVDDPDLNTNLNFSISEDNSGGKFTIFKYTNETGGCLMLKTSLDFETMPQNLHGVYNLTATVSDGKYSDTREIKIHVQDVNDNSPFFNQSQYSVSVSEDAHTATSIFQMLAYDNDAIDIRKLTYSLQGADSSFFIIKNYTNFGDLEVNTKLDRENRSSYTVTVMVEDSAGHFGHTEVHITVLDVNDNDPKFVNSTYTYTHLEGNSSIGFQMIVSTVDPDLGDNGTDFFILSDTHDGLFNITTLPNNTGVITVLAALDRESPNVQKIINGTAVYTLHVEALDRGNPQKSAMTVITLNVQDINDCVPQFEKSHYNATVLEGSPKGFSILAVKATDCDYNEEYKNITYTLKGKDSELFEIDKDGLITLSTTISVQSLKDRFDLVIVANDSLNSNHASLTIIISDVNDHDPVFTYSIYNFTTPETNATSTTGIFVGVVNATDEDLGNNGVITYSIISMDVEHLFSISQDGTITVIGSLDSDQCISNRYPFTVIAKDNGTASRTGYTEVIVYVTDVNDNYPVFTQKIYLGTVPENSPVNTPVNIIPPITATDIDSGYNGTAGIRYSLRGTNLFRIDEHTGEVVVSVAHLDRENQSMYNVQVRAADRNGTGLMTMVTVTIELQDVNDEPPIFSNDSYTFFINESAVAGEKVGVVMATDKDINGNITTRYRIASGSDGKFYIDILSGIIYTSGGLDREKKIQYDLIIEAFDGQQETNTTVSIYLKDANDNCPVFPSQMLVASVPENTKNSTVVYNLTATDLDENENADIHFYTNHSGTSLFIIERNQLVLNGSLDREILDHYMFMVYAEDKGNPPCQASSTMEILITDVNDNPPMFYDTDNSVTLSATVAILEKSPVGSPILLPDVRDIDTGNNSKVLFNLTAEKRDILNYFKINPSTGVVTISAQVDLNSLNQLHILDQNATKHAALDMTVVATDQGVPPLSSNLLLTVVVEGINDQAPVFLKPEYYFTISEDMPFGSWVGIVQAIVENGTNYNLRYSLISNSNAAKYFNVASVSGNITTVTSLDREKTPSFSFAVQVKDGKIPERTAYTVVNVTVTDVNDNYPEFKQRSYEYIVEENITPLPIYILAVDPDLGDNGTVAYALMANPGNHFVMNISGALSVNGTLDREEQPVYNLTLLAYDKGSPRKTSSVEVIVIVLDQNDNKPEFNNINIPCKVRENQPAGTHVCDVKARDPDSGLNGSVVYMFAGKTSPLFDIDPLAGHISTLVSLDYEKQSMYNLTIMAMDLGTPELNSTTVVFIQVEDEYDTAPHFTRSIYEQTVDVDIPTSSVILIVQAGTYNVHYTIEDGNNRNLFDINGTSGEITLVSRLSVLGNYHLNVSATDGNTTDFAQVLIHVTKANSNIKIQSNTYTAKIPENINATTLLIDLNYTDGSNTKFQYDLLDTLQKFKDTFYLNQTTGELYCLKALDREDINQYVLHIRAIPASNRMKRSFGDSAGDIVVIVEVQDENDNKPQFNGGQSSLFFGIPDTVVIGDLVTTLKAEDADISSIVQYSLSGGQNKDSFLLDFPTGKVYSQVKVKTQETYSIMVTATDGKLSTEVKVVFIVISSNDKLILTIPITPSEFETRKTVLLRNISAIVGFKVQMEKYDAHVESKKFVDITSTDIYFHGINETVGFVLPQQVALSIIRDKSKEIAELFNPHKIEVVTYHPSLLPHKMSESEIALLTIGIIILLSCILALLAAKYTWNQFETSQKTLQDKIWELSSLHSSHTNGTVAIRQRDVGVINPAYKETQFGAEDQVCLHVPLLIA